MSEQPGATSAKDQETLGADAQFSLITQGETVSETKQPESSTNVKEKELRERLIAREAKKAKDKEEEAKRQQDHDNEMKARLATLTTSDGEEEEESETDNLKGDADHFIAQGNPQFNLPRGM